MWRKTISKIIADILEGNPKVVYMKQSSARGERINATVGGVHKRNHKLQVKVREDDQTCKKAQTQPNCLYNFLVQIMRETGFIIKESQPSLESNTLTDFYKTRFGLAEKCQKKGFVECTGSVTGKYLSILGVLIKNDIGNGESMDEDIEPLNLGLKISSYVEKGYAVVKDKKRNELQAIFEDFAKKLMEISRTELGLTDPKPTFNSLPSKVKEHIASFLDMRSLVRFAQVSKDLSKLSSNDQLWNRFLSEAVESTGKVGNCSKEAVKYVFTLRRCLKDHEKGQQKNRSTGRENRGPKFYGISGPRFHENWGPKFLPDGTLDPGFEINPYPTTHFLPSPDARPRGEFYLPRRASRTSRRSMYPNDGFVHLNAPGSRTDPMGLFSSEYFQSANVNSHYGWDPCFPENYEMCG